jgi:Phosphotransferase enzyme family
MPKQSASELDEHPAIKAWRVLQPGRVEFQGIPLTHIVPEAPGVRLVLEADDNVISITHEDHVARGLVPSPAQRFEDVVPLLLDCPLTIIHGEYYPPNILWREEVIYPVDWESAAVAAGEIDLAALTEGWPPGFVEQCELEYQRARWPEGPPTGFERRLAAARLYLHFRWLGSETDRAPSLWRFEQLRCEGERLGLV